MKCYFVYITTPGVENARRIGCTLVEERLAACANVVDGMESVYRWDGRVVDDKETILIVKTTEACLERLEAMVKELHTYDVPCIVALPIEHGSREYLDWVRAECK